MNAPDRIGRRIALASMVTSAGLAAAKITVGVKANSTAVVSDGFESAGDVLASGLVVFGLLMAAKPPDAEHPYGHGRLESVSGLAVGMILVAVGALISVESIQRALGPHGEPAAFAMWPLAVSIVIKSVMYLGKRQYGRKLRSSALVADSWNDALDVLSGSMALAGVGLEVFNPSLFATADDFGGFAVGLIVIALGVHVVRDTAFQLMDTMPQEELMQEIRAVAVSVPGALGIEKCYARKTGLQYHVDLHLEVDPHMTVEDSHEIATQVRNRIRQQLSWVADVLVHVEPHMFATLGSDRHGES